MRHRSAVADLGARAPRLVREAATAGAVEVGAAVIGVLARASARGRTFGGRGLGDRSGSALAGRDHAHHAESTEEPGYVHPPIIAEAILPSVPNRTETLTSEDLATLSARTVAHYDKSASSFAAATRDHDVSQNYAALLGAIEGTPPFRILDLGCGPGRDLAYFRSLGHEAVGLDASARFVAMAHAATGCEVLHQSFLDLALEPARFDGIFANASLFHVPTQELARVLAGLREALVPRGVLFSSNPRGQDTEGYSGERYGAFHSLETWRAQVTAAGFTEIDHYYRPAGLPREQQPWLATVWRR
jgi:SAM-dependent methyltransferase